MCGYRHKGSARLAGSGICLPRLIHTVSYPPRGRGTAVLHTPIWRDLMNRVTSNDGTPIAFDRTGDGPAVILVGGAFQVRVDPKMSQLAALLAPRYSVLTYDRRGRGDSGDTAPYAVEREVGDLEALIKEAGGSAFVSGMSSGAVLALDAAAYGLPIMKLAVYEPPFIVDSSRAALPANYLAQLTDLLSADRRGDAVALFMTNPAGVAAEFVAGIGPAPFWPAMWAVR